MSNVYVVVKQMAELQLLSSYGSKYVLIMRVF